MPGERNGGHERKLSGEERRRLLVLGLPTFGMALAITAVSTYMPVVARGFETSTTIIGLIIGSEGLMALWLPLTAGAWSDRLDTPLGGRLPFVLAGAPVMVVCLALAGAVNSLFGLAIFVFVFFFGYYTAYEPYRALYPDLLGEEVAGRAQSAQAGWRGAGTGLALVSGGALLSVADFLPFAVFAGLLAASIGLFVWLLRREGLRDPGGGDGDDEAGARDVARNLIGLLREHSALRFYMGANALWELALGAIKTFVILYVTAGLGFSLGEASLIVGAVALVVLAGALLSGKAADRYGRLRVSEAGLWVYGVTLLIPGFTVFHPALIAATPFIAFGGGMLMSLPYSLLMPLMPETEHGAVTGLYSASRGIGVMAGPLLAGGAISVAKPVFSSTQGYAAMWLVAGGAILASIALLRGMRARAKDRAELREGAGEG